MASTGLRLVGTGANIAGDGDDWSDATNITTEADYAITTIGKSGGLSDYLRGTNLGFSVPSGATVNGVELQIRHNAQSNANTSDEFVYLVENGAIISGCQNKASATAWDYDPETFTYGGASDTWNCSLTPTTVNSNTFGAQIIAQNNGTWLSEWASVYWIKINVYYTESGGSSNIKSIAGVVQARIKSIAGVAEANIKSVAGVSN